MKKTFLSLALAAMLVFGSTSTCLAASPTPIGTYKSYYTPISQQSWYKDLQRASKALGGTGEISLFKNIKIKINY